MVTDDIVTRLRESNGMTTSRSDDGFLSIHPDTDLMRQAADEIERLRQELIQANNQIKLLIAIETAGKDL
jgi:hypothetical protein